MDDKPRRQSCGMPLGAPGYFGTEVDGTENKEFCKFCFQNGNFTEEKARELSTAIIPSLKRWKK